MTGMILGLVYSGCLSLPTQVMTDMAKSKYLSHPPIRQIPRAPKRPKATGPTFFVDASKGDDAGPGSKGEPWKTINHAMKQVRAGHTLYLREGSYFENIYCAAAGTPDAPITIRAYPGERVTIDGGIPEFQIDPYGSWEPYSGGAEGEYTSTKVYRNVRDVLGLFGDSNVGLQTYWHLEDLRAENEFWDADPETKAIKPVYCGPGLWYDKQTGRIHARLAHTHIDNPKVTNYQGVTDPRQVPLVVAPFSSVPLFVDQGMYVHFQDLIIRGGGFNTVVLQFGVGIEFDNVTIYCATYGLRSRGTGPMRFANSALYGMIPPWGFRTENGLYTYTPTHYDPFYKDPKAPTRNVARLPTHAVLVTEGSFEFEVFYYPHNHDWEIVNSEFTDGHDGIYLSGSNIRFHHNWVHNFQDDAIYLSSPTPYFNGDIRIYQNLITKSLMAFGCHSRGGPTGDTYIFRNIADLREPVNARRPTSENPQGTLTTYHIFLTHGRGFLGIESMYFYQNTFLSNAYTGGYCHRTLCNTWEKAKRRVFNNICVYLDKYGDLRVPAKPPIPDIQCDGNLHWCSNPEAKLPKDYLKKVQMCPASEASKKDYPSGWSANAVLGDPRFVSFAPDPASLTDYRLRKDSPAIGRGIVLPEELEDPLRAKDGSRPDIGALPLGSEPLKVGRFGRISVP